jgi:hypothetical protein
VKALAVRSTSQTGDVGGPVSATLSFAVGAPASFGAFAPGVEHTYTAAMRTGSYSRTLTFTLSTTSP